eukprot:5806031-Ditylum_brightwellii.AAC.1
MRLVQNVAQSRSWMQIMGQLFLRSHLVIRLDRSNASLHLVTKLLNQTSVSGLLKQRGQAMLYQTIFNDVCLTL